MSRKPKSTSVYDRIEETQLEITSTEQRLAQLKTQLKNLLNEKDELEMKEAWKCIQDSGMTLAEVQKLLEKQSKAK